MGLFKNILNKIFHAGGNAEAPHDALRSGQTNASPVAAARIGVPLGTGVISAQPGATAASVDVAASLDGLAAKHPEKLDWKHSIVDRLKLLGMDSSLGGRKELAADLSYTGDTNDSATMNIWLHKEVMRKLAENGGENPGRTG